MRLLTKSEIQQRELNILSVVYQFCQENNLRMFLSGGTLLGAIRHHGFIPWDDDIDICMPRPDYETFMKTFPKDGRYHIQSDVLGNFHAPFSKMVDMDTEIDSMYSEKEKHLWVDIFPVDGLPSDMQQVEKIYNTCHIYRKLLLIGHAKLGRGKSLFHKYGKCIIKPIVNLIGNSWFSRKIDQVARRIPYGSTEYVGAITWGLYGVGERMLKSEFEKQVLVEFEGLQFPTFSCWDSYLKGLYHDYMQLPPVEKRQTHDMKVYVKD